MIFLGACEYHVPSNDAEFYDMCDRNWATFIVRTNNYGANQYCLDKIETYHRNSKAKGRIPYANGDTTVFNYKYWD